MYPEFIRIGQFSTLLEAFAPAMAVALVIEFFRTDFGATLGSMIALTGVSLTQYVSTLITVAGMLVLFAVHKKRSNGPEHLVAEAI